MEELKRLATEYLALNTERDTLNEKEDYDAAFDIECTQRDIVDNMVDQILNLQGK